jgi:hypothetical protein
LPAECLRHFVTALVHGYLPTLLLYWNAHYYYLFFLFPDKTCKKYAAKKPTKKLTIILKFLG